MGWAWLVQMHTCCFDWWQQICSCMFSFDIWVVKHIWMGYALFIYYKFYPESIFLTWNIFYSCGVLNNYVSVNFMIGVIGNKRRMKMKVKAMLCTVIDIRCIGLNDHGCHVVWKLEYAVFTGKAFFFCQKRSPWHLKCLGWFLRVMRTLYLYLTTSEFDW